MVWTVAADIFSKKLRATKKDVPAFWELCVSYSKRHKMTRFTRRTGRVLGRQSTGRSCLERDSRYDSGREQNFKIIHSVVLCSD